jgi:hypothetical protein
LLDPEGEVPRLARIVNLILTARRMQRAVSKIRVLAKERPTERIAVNATSAPA